VLGRRKGELRSPCSPCSPWSRAFARDHGCARLRAVRRGAPHPCTSLRARVGARGPDPGRKRVVCRLRSIRSRSMWFVGFSP
jgi:hypothetical protein